MFLKDSIFEASSPTRHTAELARLLKKSFPNTTAVVLYTDGGPDHNCKHISVRLGLLALFLELDLDTMVVMRTAPTQSWGNPVERVMSVLNLGLQGVALAREELIEENYEKEMKRCNGMSAVRKVAETHEEVVEMDLVAEECAEGDDALRDVYRQEQQEDDDFLEMLHHDDDRDLEEENVLLRVTHQKDQELIQRRRGRYEIDMTGWDDDEDEDDEDLRLQSSTRVQPAQSDSIDLANKDTTNIRNPFIDSYLKSIRPARDIICGQWKECTWDEKSLNIEAPASDNEVKSPSTPSLCFYATRLRPTNNN